MRVGVRVRVRLRVRVRVRVRFRARVRVRVSIRLSAQEAAPHGRGAALELLEDVHALHEPLLEVGLHGAGGHAWGLTR